MRITEITSKIIKPLTPEQARISALKQQKERVSTQLKTERERQKKQKATQQLQQSNHVLAKINHS
jgi:hypothetical protein